MPVNPARHQGIRGHPPSPCGLSSTSFTYAIADSWGRISKPIHVYYIGDHDPSGRMIEESIQSALEEYSGKSFHWTRLAVRAGNTLTDSISSRWSRNVRTPDTPGSLKQYGRRCAEVEAVPADVLRDMVGQAIESHIPSEEWNRLTVLEKKEKQSWQEVMGKIGAELPHEHTFARTAHRDNDGFGVPAPSCENIRRGSVLGLHLSRHRLRYPRKAPVGGPYNVTKNVRDIEQAAPAFNWSISTGFQYVALDDDTDDGSGVTALEATIGHKMPMTAAIKTGSGHTTRLMRAPCPLPKRIGLLTTTKGNVDFLGEAMIAVLPGSWNRNGGYEWRLGLDLIKPELLIYLLGSCRWLRTLEDVYTQNSREKRVGVYTENSCVTPPSSV